MLEAVARSTAPAACIVAQSNADTLVLLVPAGSHDRQPKAIVQAVEAATEPAKEGMLVLFGVKPDCPHIGCGSMRENISRAAISFGTPGSFSVKPQR